MSNVLFNQHPLIVPIETAKILGLDEAIIIQQIHYWLLKSKHEYDGKIWIYNSYTKWHEQFPFWSISKIRRIIKNLEKKELIISGNYNKLKIDQTKWYTINYKKLEEYFPDVQNEQIISSDWSVQETKLDKPLPKTTTKTNTETTYNINNTLKSENFNVCNYNIFNSLKKGNYIEGYEKEVCDKIRKYFKEYKYRLGRQHPPVKDEQMTNILMSFSNLWEYTGFEEYRKFDEVQESYFLRNDIDTDYNINHFGAWINGLAEHIGERY